MSHELRTPLNAIIGFSDLLQERIVGDLNAKQLEYVRDIAESGRHQLALINDILDLSKVEAGKLEFRPESFDPAAALVAVHAIVAPLATKKDLHLTFRADGQLPLVEHDQARFKQVFYNLLSNAVKFTPDRGDVTTTARGVDDRLEIEVADTGIGIAPADLHTIFEEFKRLDSAYAREQQGTGLGLSLVRRMVERMGGSVSVTTEVGKGSRFTVRLPIRMPVAAS